MALLFPRETGTLKTATQLKGREEGSRIQQSANGRLIQVAHTLMQDKVMAGVRAKSRHAVMTDGCVCCFFRASLQALLPDCAVPWHLTVTLQLQLEYFCRPSGVSWHSYLYCTPVSVERHTRDSSATFIHVLRRWLMDLCYEESGAFGF